MAHRKVADNDLTINDLSMVETQALHESQNPQLLAQQFNINNNIMNSMPNDVVQIQKEEMQIIEEHVDNNMQLIGFEDEPPFDMNPFDNNTNQFTSSTEMQSQQLEQQINNNSITAIDEVDDVLDKDKNVDNNDNDNVVNQEINNTANVYPIMHTISKESFTKFVNSLDILKNLKQNVIFEQGVSHFVSDSKSYFCKFDIHCPQISFKIPYVEQQASQLAFLTNGAAVTILESEDDYIFNEGNFKFQLRKTIEDENTWNAETFNKLYNNITNKPLIAQYEFTDKKQLDVFLRIIKGVRRNNIDFYTTDDNSHLILDRGDVNSGKFELLKIPCNLEATNNQKILSVIDSVCLMNEYGSMKIAFYYISLDQDIISIVISGRLKDDYDITFISNVYRNFQM